jgi:hypothetical protein
VERWQDVRQILSQEVTAFGRLEFCGPFRLEGLHSHMKKTKLDYKALMPDVTNFDDEICMAQLAARAGKIDMLSNEEKKIVKNDSSYERHSQFAEEVGTAYGLNLFDNFDTNYPEKLDSVVDEKSAVQFILEMFDEFDVTANLFYDPSIHDTSQARDTSVKEGEDDMFVYCREGFIRSLLSMAYDMCEAEGDAAGWRTLRRIMVTYFLASNLKSQNSKYALWTMLDLVVELAASERSQSRMQHTMVVNTSGRRGGGKFMDKYCEHCVREVKGCLRSCHGKVDDLLLEKILNGLSTMSLVCQHDAESTLRGKVGQKSHDFVGEKARDIIEEQVSKADPFCRGRETKHEFFTHVRGSPYSQLIETEVERFLHRAAEAYQDKY